MFRVKTNFAEISIDSNSPDRSAPIVVSSDNPDLASAFAQSLSIAIGFQGHMLGDKCSPLDLHSALLDLKLRFDIVEGAEILDMLGQQLPEGAVW